MDAAVGSAALAWSLIVGAVDRIVVKTARDAAMVKKLFYGFVGMLPYNRRNIHAAKTDKDKATGSGRLSPKSVTMPGDDEAEKQTRVTPLKLACQATEPLQMLGFHTCGIHTTQ